MKVVVIVNVRHPEWEGSRIEQLAETWEREGLVRRLRPGSYVVTATGIDAGMVEELSEYRTLCARYRATRAALEVLKAEYEQEYGPLPKEGTTAER